MTVQIPCPTRNASNSIMLWIRWVPAVFKAILPESFVKKSSSVVSFKNCNVCGNGEPGNALEPCDPVGTSAYKINACLSDAILFWYIEILVNDSTLVRHSNACFLWICILQCSSFWFELAICKRRYSSNSSFNRA